MGPSSELVSLGFLIFDVLLLTVLSLRTLTNMYARGARSLLLLLLSLLMMMVFHTGALLVTHAESRTFLFLFELFFFMLIPLAWGTMVYELAEIDTKTTWKVLGPVAVINFLYFGLLQSTRVGSSSLAFGFHGCTTQGFITVCDGDFSPLLFGFFSLLLVEMLIGVGFLIWYYFRYPNVKDRAQILTIALSIIAMPVFTGIIVAIFGARVVSPMPIAILVMVVFLFTAVYYYKVLAVQFQGKESISMVDDLMLVVDNKNIIQDFNLSTLNVLGFQSRSIANVQLEHAFFEFPRIVELFHHNTTNGDIELIIGENLHEFEPSIVSVVDPSSGEVVGKRLQLHDITKKSVEEDTTSIIRDRLTNQYTRETFFSLGRKVFSNAKRLGQPITMVVMDIDDFQNVNNRYTWVVGDEALVQLVDVVHHVIRNSDMMARFDSDNFVLLMPSTDENTAYHVCLRIKEAVATNIFNYQGQELQFTVSQGFAVYDGKTDSTLEGFYETARAALMQSRGEGRNRVAHRELRRG